MASQSILEIVIRAVDESAAALNGAMGNLKEVGQAAIGTGVQLGIAGAAILAPLALSVSAAEESQNIYTQLQAVLKSTAGAAGITADKAVELSKALEHQTTFSDEAVLSTENLLLTFTNIKDDIFPDATKAVLNMSVALGEDTKNGAIQLGKALQDPILGVTALRRVGVDFSADQVKVSKSLVESGNTLEAQKLILKELNTEFGGSAAAAATTFAGKMDQLQNSVNDVQEQIGNALIPVLVDLLKTVTPIITAVAQWIEKHPKLTEIIIIFVGVLGALLTVFGALYFAMGGILIIVGLLGGPITILIILIGLLTSIIIANWSSIKDNIDAILTWINNFIKSTLDGIHAAWSTVWGGVRDFFVGIWTGMKSAVQSAINFIRSILRSTIKAIGSAASGIMSGVKGVISGAASVIGIHDAIITPSGQVIQSDPADYLFATKNPSSLGGGGGVTINLNGGMYLNENS
jgi:phage-related protein